VLAEELAPANSKYVVSGEWVSVRDLARMAGEIEHVRVPWFVCPLGLMRAAAPFAVAWARLSGRRATFTSVTVRALQGSQAVSHARASRELGYAPRPFRATLEDTLGWFAAQGLLKSAAREERPALQRA
jgi:dihydroflavonol-4-reductase